MFSRLFLQPRSGVEDAVVIGLGVVTGACVAAFVGIGVAVFVSGENVKSVSSQAVGSCSGARRPDGDNR